MCKDEIKKKSENFLRASRTEFAPVTTPLMFGKKLTIFTINPDKVTHVQKLREVIRKI